MLKYCFLIILLIFLNGEIINVKSFEIVNLYITNPKKEANNKYPLICPFENTTEKENIAKADITQKRISSNKIKNTFLLFILTIPEPFSKSSSYNFI